MACGYLLKMGSLGLSLLRTKFFLGRMTSLNLVATPVATYHWHKYEAYLTVCEVFFLVVTLLATKKNQLQPNL
jgi:hypothetical protein